jgi:hypothetical protein
MHRVLTADRLVRPSRGIRREPKWRAWATIAVLVMIGLGSASVGPLTATAAVTPTVTITPGTGPKGTAVSAQGGGYVSGEKVVVKYLTGLRRPRAVDLCVTRANPDGTFACSGAIPTGDRAGARGPHTILAKGKQSLIKATTVFTLNRPPDAVDDFIGVMDDAPTVIDPLGNDTDPDGDALTITALGGTAAGIPTIVNGGTAVSYDPTLNGLGSTGGDDDSFTYTITDAHGATDTATASVRVWGGFDYAARCIPLVLSKTTVQPGETITVSGRAASANASLEVLFNGDVVATTISGSEFFNEFSAPAGPFSTPVTIPSNAPTGLATIQVVQNLSYTQAAGCSGVSAHTAQLTVQ